MNEKFFEKANLPYIKSFSKPCFACGAEMEISDKTDIKRRQKGILDVHGKCIVCAKQLQVSTIGDSGAAVSQFNLMYDKHRRKAMLKKGTYKIVRDNLWNFIGKASALCITTNGFTKRSGHAVMGRGCAAQALKRYPSIDKKLGDLIQDHGNRPMRVTKERNTSIVSFPVKPIYRTARSEEELENKCVKHMVSQLSPDLGIKDKVFIPGWATKAEVAIIRDSAQKLVAMADKFDWKLVALPLPGCGAGELQFEKDVKPILDKILDQRFILVTYPERR